MVANAHYLLLFFLSVQDRSIIFARIFATSLNKFSPVAFIQASRRFDVSICVSYCPNEKESLVILPGINVL